MPSRPILFALALALASQPAAAKEQAWIEARSPHFTVISNASPKEARKAAENFEQIRAVFEKAFPKSRVDPNQPAPASSQPAPASSATAPPPPDFGATTWGEGRAVEVACLAKTLALKLVFEGYPLRLRSDAAASISYSVGQRQRLAAFHPCPGLKGKYLKVEYRVAVGKSYDGDILKIDIQP